MRTFINVWKEYNRLAEEILSKHPQLSLKDELRFYELHSQVQTKNIEAAYKLVEYCQWLEGRDDKACANESQLRARYKILEDSRLSEFGLNRRLYNYLCFIKWRYKIVSEAGSPMVSKPTNSKIPIINSKFSHNSIRAELFEVLLKGLKKCIEVFELQKIRALIGGSFVNEKEFPSDVDVVLLLPQKKYRMDYYQNQLQRKVVKEFKLFDLIKGKEIKKFDLITAPEDWKDELYMKYEILTLFGNKPEILDDEGLHTNTFLSKDFFIVETDAEEINEYLT